MFRKFCSVIALISFFIINFYCNYTEAKDRYENSRIYSGTVEGFISNVSSIAKRNGINLKIKNVDKSLGWGDHSYDLTLGTGNYITVNPIVLENTDSLVNLWIYFSLTDNYKYDDGYRANLKQNFLLIYSILYELGIEENEIKNKFIKPFTNDIDKEIKKFKKNYSYDNDDDHIFVDKSYKVYCKKMNIYLEISGTISIYKENNKYGLPNSMDFKIEKV